jgi:hypothetical protein
MYVALGHCHLLLGRVREIQAHDTDPGAAFFSSTARSEVDYLYSDFGAASSGRFMPRDSSDAIVTPKLLLRLESLGSSGGSCAAGAGARNPRFDC